MKRDGGIIPSEIGSKLLTGKPQWPIKVTEGKRNTAGKRQMGRPAVRQLLYFLNYGKTPHRGKYPEDSLVAFTCPALCCCRELILL